MSKKKKSGNGGREASRNLDKKKKIGEGGREAPSLVVHMRTPWLTWSDAENNNTFMLNVFYKWLCKGGCNIQK